MNSVQIVLTPTTDPNVVELRASSVHSDTASKPAFIVRTEHLSETLLLILRAAQTGVIDA